MASGHVYVVVKFGPGITAVLNEIPLLVRRMRSAHGLGAEIELDRLDGTAGGGTGSALIDSDQNARA